MAKMFSLLLICTGVGFGKSQSEKNVILPNTEVTYETSSNMKTTQPDNSMTSSYHVLKRTIQRNDDDDDDSGNTEDRKHRNHFAVRLNFSGSSPDGRLEIFYSGIWGTVCNSGFTNVSARVACASLGFGYKGTVVPNRHGAGTGPIWLDGVNCTGTESGIEQCAHNGWGVNNCSHHNDVSIRCACGIRNFSAPTGTISSPNFPGNYTNDLECHNYITISPEETIIIKFLAFDTEPDYDWVTIICESGNAYRSTRFSGSELPQVLTLSFCKRITVHFRSGTSGTNTGFSLTYNVTTDIFIGGIITRPSNAFPRARKKVTIIFNCTTSSKYSPWWTINQKMTNRTITNSTCGVITSPDSIRTEKSGPGSCNLILTLLDNHHFSSTVSFVCTDATLSSARAILQQIQLELTSSRSNTSLEIGKDIVRDEAIRISCNPSFAYLSSNKSLYFSLSLFPFFVYNGGPVVQMRILRTYWTSQGIVVPSTDTSSTSSYVMVKAPKDGVIPPYTCNIVCDFFSNITDISDVIDVSVSTEPMEVLYWPTEENMTVNGHDNGQIRTPAVLTCNAAANPPANYTWIDESNGQRTSGPILIIKNGGEYTCNASNIIRGRPYQQSKSVTLQVVRDEMPQNMQVLILLGIAFVAIIILLAILLSRICRPQKINPGADAGDAHRGNVCELQQRGEGGEGNIYESVLDNDSHVYESEYDKLDAMRRRLPAIPKIYDTLVGGCDEHENGLGRVTDANESEYDKIDDSSQRLPCLSGIYDELEFDK